MTMQRETTQTEPRKGKDSKKGNPVVSTIMNAVVKPADKLFEALLGSVEQAGLNQQVQYPFYLNQDTLWWNVMRQLFDFEILGSEKIPPEGEGALLCVNHQSFFDPIIFCVSIAHYSRRRLHCMAKAELFEVPVVNSYIRWCYAFPIHRGQRDEEAYNKAVELLKAGELVGMYPEGTLNGGGFNLLQPHSGAARLAIDAGVPIIPLGISGSDKILGKGAKLPALNTKLTVRFGDPINVHDKHAPGEIPGKDALQAIMDEVMTSIKDLLLY